MSIGYGVAVYGVVWWCGVRWWKEQECCEVEKKSGARKKLQLRAGAGAARTEAGGWRLEAGRC